MSICPKKTGQRIVKFRKFKGITQIELAERSGLGVRTLSKIEKGHDAKSLSYTAIAHVLSVPVLSLFHVDSKQKMFNYEHMILIEYYLEQINKNFELIKKVLNLAKNV